MPFKLREIMVKNWKRHRDVPTTIDELVDETFDDLRERKLDLTQRSQVNAIKPEKLMKVNSLLNDIRKVDVLVGLCLGYGLARGFGLAT